MAASPSRPRSVLKYPLVPERSLCFRRRRARRSDRVLDGVAADEDRGPHALRVKRRGDARRAAAPVVARNGETRQAERVGEVDQILPDRRLLAPCAAQPHRGIASDRSRADTAPGRGARPLVSAGATSSHARTSSGKPCSRITGNPCGPPRSSYPIVRVGVWTSRVAGRLGLSPGPAGSREIAQSTPHRRGRWLSGRLDDQTSTGDVRDVGCDGNAAPFIVRFHF